LRALEKFAVNKIGKPARRYYPSAARIRRAKGSGPRQSRERGLAPFAAAEEPAHRRARSRATRLSITISVIELAAAAAVGQDRRAAGTVDQDIVAPQGRILAAIGIDDAGKSAAQHERNSNDRNCGDDSHRPLHARAFLRPFVRCRKNGASTKSGFVARPLAGGDKAAHRFASINSE